jgi:hypothetical protein
MIDVSMEGGQLVVRPVGRLDDEAVDALRTVLEGARAAGAVAVVDLAAAEWNDVQAALSASAGR